MYTPQYTSELEFVYGTGMMTDGGPEATEEMFKGIDLYQKHMLDIGSGLGGMAFYLAEKYEAHVTGVDINPWMIATSNSRRSGKLTELTQFDIVNGFGSLSAYPDNSFDIVYSKGSLIHVPEKSTYFSEILRVLKPGGQLIVADWYSPTLGHWTDPMEEMIKMEKFILVAETQESFTTQLQSAGFVNVVSRSMGEDYFKYNQAIVDNLQKESVKAEFIQTFTNRHEETVVGFQLVSASMFTGDIFVLHFSATKPEPSPEVVDSLIDPTIL